MKKYASLWAFLAIFALAGSAKGDLVLDDFNGGNFLLFPSGSTTGALGADISGDYEYSVSGGLLTGGTGNLTASFTSSGESFTLSYSNLPNLDLHSSGAFPGSPLVLDIFSNGVVGEFSLVATYSGGAGTASFSPIAINDSTSLIALNGGELGNGAIASSVTDIDLDFTVTALDGGQASIVGNGSSIAAVPEPTSLSLLGIVGLAGGFVANRRRRKQPAGA